MRPARRILALLVALGAVLAGCGESYQVAARVGDTEITHDELAEKAEAFAASERFMTELGVEPGGDGEVPQQAVVEVLNIDVQSELARIAVGDQLEGPQVDQLRAQVDQQLAPYLESFPDDLRAETVDDIVAIQFANANGVGPADAEVYVSPRYGEVEPTGLISAPSGPLPDPSGSAPPAAPTGP